MLDTEQLMNYIRLQWQQEVMPSLCDYIKIPNKSPHFDANWEANGYMEQAVSHIADWCLKHPADNMTLEICRLPGRTPLLLMDVPGQNEETILLYGHLDKQPEMLGWDEGLAPWNPVLKEGKLYGRGAADDGYAVYAALTAIRALRSQNLNHARCLILIEACEESGSFDLPYYIDMLKDKIGQPSLVIGLDSGAGNYEQLWMTTSLRGNVVGELTVELVTEGVHSGNASGIVADSFRVARSLLERIEDESSGAIKLPELYADPPKARVEEAEYCADMLGDGVWRAFPLHTGVMPLTQNKTELILNRTWRPALTVTGAEGLPAIADAGNVLRPKTTLKLSMRLPPTVNAQYAAAILSKTLQASPPYQALVSFHLEDAAMGWHAPMLSPWLKRAAKDASMAFFNKPAAYMGEGGSIPFMAMLGEQFPQAQFMITGVLGPHSNAHGPNEFLHLSMVEKVTACVAFVINSHFIEYSGDK